MSIRKTAAILSHLDAGHIDRLLAFVDERDEKLARQLRDEMVLFSDLLLVDERGMQHLLRDVEPAVLVVALKGAEWRLVEKILDNLSPRAADNLRDDLATIGPVHAHRVKAARLTILQAARQLQAQGLLWFVGKGRDQDVIY
ncbi:MAG: hypothetical protein H7838_02780 [Magnetococcus sp. DMHC-8]